VSPSGLRAVQRQEPRVRARPRSELSNAWRAWRGRDLDVFVSRDVVERMLELGRSEAPKEWMGILLGHLFRDEDGDYIVVHAFLRDANAIARIGSVVSTHESEARAQQLARVLFPDLLRLGWAHGHVDCGTGMSGTDLATQRTWSSRNALGIVADPWRAEQLSVFRGPAAERLVEVPVAPASAADQPAAPSHRGRHRRYRRALQAGSIVVSVVLILGVVVAGLRLRNLESRIAAVDTKLLAIDANSGNAELEALRRVAAEQHDVIESLLAGDDTP
jgi:proteasome lid subunit RPN8/RPN11